MGGSGDSVRGRSGVPLGLPSPDGEGCGALRGELRFGLSLGGRGVLRGRPPDFGLAVVETARDPSGASLAVFRGRPFGRDCFGSSSSAPSTTEFGDRPTDGSSEGGPNRAIREPAYQTPTPGVDPLSSLRNSRLCRARKRPKAGLYVAPRTGIGSVVSVEDGEMSEIVAEDIGVEETVEAREVS